MNIVTEALFEKYRMAADYANAEPAAFEQEIKRIGLYRNKARNIPGVLPQAYRTSWRASAGLDGGID